MFQIKNFTDNNDVRVLETRGAFTVVEYLRDLSDILESERGFPLS